ncbi:HD-GYP domain-containing protein [Desulfohalovibrio reitneri]|uniref:HD-GYP domain-containing protein n=1 Tax=Desulfohalovibrio reitneri TaxID=1307759 RepID=UPI000559037F|nr:HD domain-containing phosphohydrolase [Desulfohalovibrio reitneri]
MTPNPNDPLGGEATGRDFFAVSPLMLFPETQPEFRVYLKQEGRYVLFTSESDRFDEPTRQSLFNLGIQRVYVPQEQRRRYARYLQDNLGRILGDPEIALEERASTFVSASNDILREVFSKRLPERVSKVLFSRVQKLVEDSIGFLGREESLKSIARLISRDYQSFTHSVNVYAFAASVLHTYGLDHDKMVEAGVGALMHDVGKAKLPQRILDNQGAPMTPEDEQTFRTHPIHGVSLCSNLPLTQESTNIILFHHERHDGQGYPGGMAGNAIPLPVRVVSVCDVYDNLTTSRPQAKARTPFMALKHMREDMQGAFDIDVFKRMVLVLSGADIVQE